ncbi:hypothetical protein M9H77_05899 [Catharanthus roseus]|uniref:Uncharacterized protein n=1 Tax=Catharanthus roseus TaxID=4058 RepID=A0ACC0BQQ7_CATRO|nr:hypothetical protein M9H77_05899 [Catharanthus roseus]
METKMIERVSRKVIKPSSPTPQSLRRYILSSFDQMMSQIYVSCAFYYTNPGHHNISSIAKKLQNSLSKALTQYYHFAGRLVENNYIDCSDQGVEFMEARIHCPINDVLNSKSTYAVDLIFPRGASPNEDCLVAFQVSYFDCGGVAIALCITHKIADACTLYTFMNNLATSTRLSSQVPTPLLLSDSIFPCGNDIVPRPLNPTDNCVSKTFTFPASKIEKLKLKAIELGISKPTRTEVISAFLFQCAKNCGPFRPSAMLTTINLRPLLGLLQNAVGNMFSSYFCIIEDERMEFPAILGELRREKLKFQNLPKEKLFFASQMQELGECLMEINQGCDSEPEVYFCSSAVGFPTQNTDFGLGKPVWMFTFLPEPKNSIFLFDSPGGEIEALVIFEEEKMSAFQNNQLLLSFTSVKHKSKL